MEGRKEQWGFGTSILGIAFFACKKGFSHENSLILLLLFFLFCFFFFFPRGLQAGEMRIIYPSELLQVFISAGFLLLSSRFFCSFFFFFFLLARSLFSFFFLSGNLKDGGDREGRGERGKGGGRSLGT